MKFITLFLLVILFSCNPKQEIDTADSLQLHTYTTDYVDEGQPVIVYWYVIYNKDEVYYTVLTSLHTIASLDSAEWSVTPAKLEQLKTANETVQSIKFDDIPKVLQWRFTN